MTVAEAAAEVQAAKNELASAVKDYEKRQMEMWDAERRHDLAKIRLEEANRVLLEVASE
jgi:hypothetical protein